MQVLRTNASAIIKTTSSTLRLLSSTPSSESSSFDQYLVASPDGDITETSLHHVDSFMATRMLPDDYHQETRSRRVGGVVTVPLSTDRAPLVPEGMVLAKPFSLRSMFLSQFTGRVYVIGGTAPLDVSPWDGLPVLRSIYVLNTLVNPLTWSLAFDGGPVAAAVVQIQSCTFMARSVITPSASAVPSSVVACSYTDAN